jgi:tetratricopeptide (TPR) repeat protein
VEVLPRDARLVLDGRAAGPGNRPLPAPPPGPHVLRVEREGYEPAERELPDGDLGGVRVAEALRPAGFASARALDYDDAEVLALAAAFLARQGDARDASDYAERALALDRGLALAHRALGDARLRLGDRRRAADAWTEYLRLAPGAPDVREVSSLVDEARGDVTVK